MQIIPLPLPDPCDKIVFNNEESSFRFFGDGTSSSNDSDKALEPRFDLIGRDLVFSLGIVKASMIWSGTEKEEKLCRWWWWLAFTQKCNWHTNNFWLAGQLGLICIMIRIVISSSFETVTSRFFGLFKSSGLFLFLFTSVLLLFLFPLFGILFVRFITEKNCKLHYYARFMWQLNFQGFFPHIS